MLDGLGSRWLIVILLIAKKNLIIFFKCLCFLSLFSIFLSAFYFIRVLCSFNIFEYCIVSMYLIFFVPRYMYYFCSLNDACLQCENKRTNNQVNKLTWKLLLYYFSKLFLLLSFVWWKHEHSLRYLSIDDEYSKY